jgi:hypothetical protein
VALAAAGDELGRPPGRPSAQIPQKMFLKQLKRKKIFGEM